ncbi:MAG: type I DNA topoisomerase [Lachnospiraceae bacterium]|nr:type I DNA topoisomerase [Lachnospiraceae bacterium]MBP3569811.1 type I DNA topoisomerase [Lachnospiraceae bacterium]
MAKYLVIVESAAKAPTIKKYLGSNYEVVASNGHVRDLPKSQMGIDVENDYEPKYITIRGKGDVLSKLRKEVKKADKVYLATDPDREGEAISWHLFHTLKLDPKTTSRITFNEITKNAVKNSIKQARSIDTNLVDAQQTRRILDRVVGYRISPVLWEKVKRGLSAGRVQSVALRLICDREEEINAFVPQEYWSLTASILADKEKKPFEAKFYGIGDKKMSVESEAEVAEIKKELEGKTFIVTDIKKGERQRKAPLPFTTSTLQQEASKLLNFSTQKTMRLAQQLYEGVEVKGYGTIALISYLRTDSTRVSEEADASVRAYISENYGKEMEAEQVKEAASGKKIQDAHEAIRPTDVTITPAQVKDSLARDLYRLYQLIWKRFVASRMQSAKYETVSVKLDAGKYRFTAAASKVVFSGFMSMYTVEDEEEEEKSQSVVAKLTKDSVLTLSELSGEQHFTQPAPHFTEASLVRTMEELGIGRPSTYAPTITTILARHYVVKENKNLYVTELGEAVNNIMKQAFPTIVDTSFTANMETLLDSIEEGEIHWKTIIRNFYPDLEQAVQEAAKKLENVKIEDEVTDVECEECGRQMVIKYGPHGKFLACPGFPECRNTKQYLEKIGIPCPECGKEIVIRKTKKGRKYYGCENNPECSYMSWQKPAK